MPAKASDKCRQCSKLAVKSAIAQARTQGFALHGTEGDGCWAGEPCHKRRTYYKKRDLYNRNRRLKYHGEKESAAQLNSITIPTVPAVIVYFYRQRKDEPLHALSVELWVGQQKKAVREPVHTLGWREANVREYITSAISDFSQQYGLSIKLIDQIRSG